MDLKSNKPILPVKIKVRSSGIGMADSMAKHWGICN